MSLPGTRVLQDRLPFLKLPFLLFLFCSKTLTVLLLACHSQHVLCTTSAVKRQQACIQFLPLPEGALISISYLPGKYPGYRILRWDGCSVSSWRCFAVRGIININWECEIRSVCRLAHSGSRETRVLSPSSRESLLLVLPDFSAIQAPSAWFSEDVCDSNATVKGSRRMWSYT